ncbi:hypothetical protein EDD64_1545 [Effusibacillus lacus]|nr:hypothetical protein EDD64_1545 [Effusibacillus lacus]
MKPSDKKAILAFIQGKASEEELRKALKKKKK